MANRRNFFKTVAGAAAAIYALGRGDVAAVRHLRLAGR